MAFGQGLSGLNSSAKALDVIGNNIANANTIGFKSSRAEFSDAYAAAVVGAQTNQAGLGSGETQITQQFTQGSISLSSRPLDVAISGSGFFRVQQPNGEIAYTRDGQFQMNKEGYLTLASGMKVTGYGSDPADATTLKPLQIPLEQGVPQQTTEVNATYNLDSRKTTIDTTAKPFDASDSTTYTSSTSATIYDGNGDSYALSSYFIKTSDTTWDVKYSLQNMQTGKTYLIKPADVTEPETSATNLSFSSNGALTTETGSPNPVATFDLSSADTYLGYPKEDSEIDDGIDAFAANFSTGSPIKFSLSGTTSYATSFGVNNLSQDGYGPGSLTGLSVGEDGSIVGQYSNGQTKTVGTIALTNFTRPEGLLSVGNNLLTETTASGTPISDKPGTGTFGVLQSGALEESNVDLTSELVNMITVQRSYQANAQTIKTADQLTQTLLNLR
jgi:flagellar hook protein FlgE